MVCLHPKTAWQRDRHHIEAGKDAEWQKRLNKISFTPKGKGWTMIEIPCGKCDGCKVDRASDWATRVMNEASCWNNKGMFLTLTYNPARVPYSKNGKMTLRRKDVKDFKKRLRKYVEKEGLAHIQVDEKNPIKTFECGEYGPTHGRPHYHMIVMNFEANDLKPWKKTEDGNILYKSATIQKIWGNGFVVIGKISYESASYVARYTMKKMGSQKRQREYYTDVKINTEGIPLLQTKFRIVETEEEAEYVGFSKGLGKEWLLENIDDVYDNNGIMAVIKGNVVIKKIPNYYKKIMKEIDWLRFERWKYQFSQMMEEAERKKIEKYNLPAEWDYETKKKWYREKRAKDIQEKLNKLWRKHAETPVREEDDWYKDIA